MGKSKFGRDHDIKALLGPNAEFEGLLSFEGTVRIDGAFQGEIKTEDCLIIGETGRVNAEIEVGRLIVMGELSGNVRAGEKVEIMPTGKVYGNLATPVMVLQDGGTLEGKVKMETGGKKTAPVKETAKEETVEPEPAEIPPDTTAAR